MTRFDSLERPIVIGSRPRASSVPARGPEVMTRRRAVCTLALVCPPARFAPDGRVDTGAAFITGSVGPAGAAPERAAAGGAGALAEAAAGNGEGAPAACDSGSLRTRLPNRSV